MSNCGKLVLKPTGKATLTKCGEIMWEEEGTWTRKNDTIRVYFRNSWDHRTFVLQKGKLHRVFDNKVNDKPSKNVKLEEE